MNDIYVELIRHIVISLVSVSIAFLVSVPISYLCYKYKLIERISFFSIQALRIVPSIALLFILIPIIGVGVFPAVISLFVLAMPPLILNMTYGFKKAYDSVLDVPYSLGLSEGYIFFRIIFPMSLTSVYLGLKLALIEVIASTTIASFIGAGGLGVIVFSGLSLNRYDLVVIGSGLIALLSLISILVMDYLILRRRRYD